MQQENTTSNERFITKHQIDGDAGSNMLQIAAIDEPGSGGANHAYEVTGFNTTSNVSAHATEDRLRIFFQNGTIPEKGLNGVTIEALIAISADRLASFQNGPFNSVDNAEALEHLNAAIDCLKRRTLKRIAREVEGREVA